MINHSIVPDNFNTSIIKPIAKDPKQSTNSINNLRPVAISESFANLYERILLEEIKKSHSEEQEQFGFKSKSSCSHAIFALKNLIKICELRQRSFWWNLRSLS